jgi:hypothetical protein
MMQKDRKSRKSRLQHQSITRFASAQMLDGIVDIAHRESFGLRGDAMAGTKI